MKVKSPAVIVPLKKDDPKSRLSGILSLQERRELVRAMLEDVVKPIESAGLLNQTYVVSSDGGSLRFASKLGARPVREASEKGVNAAVERGMKETLDSEGWLVLPGDIPFLTTRDLSRVLGFCESGASIVISPSREFNGTNLLLLGRGSPLRLSYDRNSFSSHLAGAARSGFSVAVYCSWTVTLDIDSVEDVSLALSQGVENATTRFLKSKMP